ncbi:MAG: ABC transporter permease, partial [Porcipelethomonas sp.]
MYFSILKKDLKRKKTMNVILIIFIILAAMFVSGSVNSIVTVSTALDSYFEKAEVPDFFAVTLGDDKGSIGSTLDNTGCVSDYAAEETFFIAPNNIKSGDKEIKGIQNSVMLQSADDMQMNYFDKNDKTVTGVSPGEVYVSAKVLNSSDLKEGDVISVNIGDNSHDLKIKGGIKDALLGSTLMGNVRFILNDADYSKIVSNADNALSYTGNLYYITTSDEQKTESELSKTDCNIVFMGSRSLIRMSYVMDMVVSVILLVASICLIIVSFVVLRFTISFTLAEEFREIGVMKAIGISNFKIRSLYMIKYLGMALAGTAVGFVLSIPFGKMLLN